MVKENEKTDKGKTKNEEGYLLKGFVFYKFVFLEIFASSISF